MMSNNQKLYIIYFYISVKVHNVKYIIMNVLHEYSVKVHCALENGLNRYFIGLISLVGKIDHYDMGIYNILILIT